MEQKNVLTKVLAIAGTVLVWFPIVAPVLLSIVLLIAERQFLFDYLMPMELFVFVLLGAGLLAWAAIRERSRKRLIIGWGFGIAVLMFFGIQIFAVVTGLASGEKEPVGWTWGVVISALIIYVLSIVLVGTSGALFLKELFRKRLSAA